MEDFGNVEHILRCVEELSATHMYPRTSCGSFELPELTQIAGEEPKERASK